VILGATLALAGCSTTDTAASAFAGDPLVSVLTSSASGLDLSESQAAGGLGSIMSLASSKLPAADYAALGKVLPNADKYIEAAKGAGVLTDPITDVGRLNQAMRKLSITPDQTSRMLVQVGDYLDKAGGDSAKNMFAGLWK
jgi:hypothetical protein